MSGVEEMGENLIIGEIGIIGLEILVNRKDLGYYVA